MGLHVSRRIDDKILLWRFHYIGPSSHDGLMQRSAPVTSRLRVNESCKYISTSDLMCSARGTRGGHVVLPWAFAPRVGLTTRFSFRRFHYIGPSSHDGATQRAAPVISRLRVNGSCKYTSTCDLMCLASGTRGGHVVLPCAFAPRVGLTTRFSFRRFHYIGPPSHDGLTQRAAPVISRLRVNDSCKYISTSDLMCLASGTRGGHVVMPWAFAPRVGLTTRFSFRRFHYIGPSSHDGLTQRAAPVISRLRVNESCKYISTSDLMCLATRYTWRTRGSAMGLRASRWIDDKIFVSAVPLHRAVKSRWLNAACCACHISIACEWQLQIHIDLRFDVLS